jgi:hypothetical protein
MAELSPQTTSSDPVYKPLSALALTGFLVSCLFAVIVVVCAALALAQGAPFFFPNWVLLVAVAGFLLSYSGASDVRTSEGVKAGAALASWGMGLSLVCGLGYFAYSYMTEWTLAQQANAFLTVAEEDSDSGFFPRLQKAGSDPIELHRAFLMTLPAFDRTAARPDDVPRMKLLHDRPGPDASPGMLSRFRQDPLVQTLIQGGDDVRIEPLGVQEWKYESRSYQVSRRYRIHSPEVTMEVVLPVKSSEGEAEGQTRTWFVDITTAQLVARNMTPRGQGLHRLRMFAGGAIEKLHQEIQKGGKLPDFAKLDKTDWERLHLDGKIRTDLKARISEVFAGKAQTGLWHLKTGFEGVWAWHKDEQNRIIIDVPFITFINNVGVEQIGVESLAQVRTRAPVDIEQIGASENIDDMPAWDIIGLKFTRATPTKL